MEFRFQRLGSKLRLPFSEKFERNIFFFNSITILTQHFFLKKNYEKVNGIRNISIEMELDKDSKISVLFNREIFLKKNRYEAGHTLVHSFFGMPLTHTILILKIYFLDGIRPSSAIHSLCLEKSSHVWREFIVQYNSLSRAPNDKNRYNNILCTWQTVNSF